LVWEGKKGLAIWVKCERLFFGLGGEPEKGDGFSEMRIDYGPGYRVYFKEICFQDTGDEIIILLCGGYKREQSSDIATAKDIFRNYRPEDYKED
jgi:putative addiction module killer protein